MITREQVDAAYAALQAQWEKFDRALERGLTGAPLVMIDKKLSRLDEEYLALYDAYKEEQRLREGTEPEVPTELKGMLP